LAQIHHLELRPVKTNQANGGSEPEITILGLGDAADPIGGQTIPAAPCLAIVLENIQGRIQRQPAARPQDLKTQRSRQQSAAEPPPFAIQMDFKLIQFG